MVTFIALAFFGFILLLGGALFGHDHDHDHDHGHDHGDAGHDSEPTVSIFSTKVIGTFIMAFGAAGAIMQHLYHDVFVASFSGLGSGLVLGGVMYSVMRIIYSQQSNSLIQTDQLIGKQARVVIAMDRNSTGQVEVTVGDLAQTYLARTTTEKSIPRGSLVTIKGNQGGMLEVEAVR